MVTRIELEGARQIPIYFREWRAWKDWSQTDIAERLGTTKQTVSRIERGVMDWGKLYLEAFSHVCDCPNPIDPISRRPDEPEMWDAYQITSEGFIAIQLKWPKLSRLQQDQLVQIIDVFIKSNQTDESIL